ncbi:serine/threonine protein kinase [Persicimonas caeni]|uniref:non-specific serine/threonine protein kinase n=1 Tax=Persicimonas caeni TaxID=2292766 RepID=A0A4Y6PP65_PERCE|nr:serine/threonine-protein kinase [Persicimonas caeni]QDG50126.1 serine/threonine protein kinase [Persicimonas caeni]QED31347.1 serine/threonine protein kinase [Persicimonas caeni]
MAQTPLDMDAVERLDGEMLDGRYELSDVLGRGGQGDTYLAVDHRTGEQVVVKEFDLDLAHDWKAVELFEREARLLERLDHDAIPRHIDAFQQAGDNATRYFLVREYIAGDSFLELIERGHHMRQSEAVALCRSVLNVLDYIHSLDPPVIHRDVKPSNLIRRPDGRVALIDFGIAGEHVQATVGGSTLVGSPGYVAPEQLSGRATPASDLYSLGATLVHLLAHRHPADLPVERLRLQFRDVVPVTGEFVDFLGELLEPNPTERLQTAREAMVRLRFDVEERGQLKRYAGAGLVPTADDLPPLPYQSKLSVSREEGRLEVELFRTFSVDMSLRTNLIVLGILVPLLVAGLFFAPGIFFTLFAFAIPLLVVTVALGAGYNNRHRIRKLALTPDYVELIAPRGLNAGLKIPREKFGGLYVVEHGVGDQRRLVLMADRGRPGVGDGTLTWSPEVPVEAHLSRADKAWLVEVFGEGSQREAYARLRHKHKHV